MKFIKKLKARRKGEILMTPLPKKDIKSYVSFEEKKLIKESSKISKEIKEVIIDDEDESYSPELVKAYQKQNPDKNAIWRGKYTKQFKTWAQDADKA